jgi:signal transduction histidine kinase
MVLYTLLAITSSLAIFLAYKARILQKERDVLLNETKEDAKILFLKSRYASMGETVGNIAHQWKQPLNAIGTIQNSIKASLIFQGEISKEKLLNSVETSFKLLQHLAETIDTFYSFLAQNGNTKTSFYIADELEKVRKITEYSFENSHITLNFELEI